MIFLIYDILKGLFGRFYVENWILMNKCGWSCKKDLFLAKSCLDQYVEEIDNLIMFGYLITLAKNI